MVCRDTRAATGGAAALGGDKEQAGGAGNLQGFQQLCWNGESAWLPSLVLGSAPSAALQETHPFLPLPN